MSDEDDSEFSPFDSFDGSGIDGHVVDAQEGRLHGFELGSDLARHYRFSEILYLTLCGDFATERQQRLFEVALIGAMRVGVGDASVHGARLAHHVGFSSNNPTAVVSAAAIGVAEMCRTEVEEHRALLAWLEDPTEEPPLSAVEPDQLVLQLHRLVGEDEMLDTLVRAHASVTTYVIALLWIAGLRTSAVITAALTSARAPVAFAEAVATPTPHLGKYPLNLPFWDYQHRKHGDG